MGDELVDLQIPRGAVGDLRRRGGDGEVGERGGTGVPHEVENRLDVGVLIRLVGPRILIGVVEGATEGDLGARGRIETGYIRGRVPLRGVDATVYKALCLSLTGACGGSRRQRQPGYNQAQRRQEYSQFHIVRSPVVSLSPPMVVYRSPRRPSLIPRRDNVSPRR